MWKLHSRNIGIYPNSAHWIRPLACIYNNWNETPRSAGLRQPLCNSWRSCKVADRKPLMHTRPCNSIEVCKRCEAGWRIWLQSFAIAYATTLCLGESPGKYSFHQAKMRSHLKQCLENEHFTMFPTIKERRHTGNNIISQVHIPVYCSCRMPAMNPMIRCHSCHEWFHVGPCVKVTPKQMKDRKFKWNCTACCWLFWFYHDT